MKEWNQCSKKERIARWENVVRVLENLTPHQRRKHWDMSWWGELTRCGTVACAAGHCGLDPWFRRRGLRLNLVKDEYGISQPDDSWDPEGFFDEYGFRAIFLNTDPRPVSKVIKEVKAHLERLRWKEA